MNGNEFCSDWMFHSGLSETNVLMLDALSNKYSFNLCGGECDVN